MRSVFVVYDEPHIRFAVGENLAREGFLVETFASLEQTFERLFEGFPDMFILDARIPSQNGLDFCQDIRSRSGIPIIFIATRGDDLGKPVEQVSNHEDCLYFPFSGRELVSKVRSVLRHTSPPRSVKEILEIGNIRIHPGYRHTVVDNNEVRLTPQEYELLLLLANQPQRTFNRQELLDRVWGSDYVGDIRAVDNLVKRLRKKLRTSGANKNVQTIWGYGYRFDN